MVLLERKGLSITLGEPEAFVLGRPGHKLSQSVSAQVQACPVEDKPFMLVHLSYHCRRQTLLTEIIIIIVIVIIPYYYKETAIPDQQGEFYFPALLLLLPRQE